MSAGTRDTTVDRARAVLALDRAGRPRCTDTRRVYAALAALRRAAGPDVVAGVVDHGFLAGARERYERHVAPTMRALPAVRFQMGTDAARVRYFCGESPRHPVELSPFAVSAYPVTNELYALFDPARAAAPGDRRHWPVADVTWYDAAVFAMWVGCRLPTEAEWEYCCGAGGPAEWCCAEERDLPRHAWYSENAGDRPHPVGTREPNTLGLYDLHGNAWEWCADDYGADWYARAPLHDPCNRALGGDHPGGDHLGGDHPGGDHDDERHKVARGGGYYALAEMCRTRFRLHDPAGYWAADLGFRLARDRG
jgi:formylglycine-generating enzyme required for sulfatase activity